MTCAVEFHGNPFVKLDGMDNNIVSDPVREIETNLDATL